MIKKSMILGDREFSIESGKMAKQALGSLTVRYGDTIVLVTATSDFLNESTKDYFPLQVEYRDRAYAAGKIPGGFFKREGRPSEKEILSARLIDRPIRPLFPDDFLCETQIVVYMISCDQKNPGDILGITGASVALSISDIPFSGPIAGVRVGRIDGEFVLNPTSDQMSESEMEIIIAGSEDSVVMVEGEAKEISESTFVEAMDFGHKAIKELIELQKELIDEVKPEKFQYKSKEIPDELKEIVNSRTDGHLEEWRNKAKVSKKMLDSSINTFVIELTKELEEQFPDSKNTITALVDDRIKKDMRELIHSTKTRIDGRNLTDIRPISCEVGILPRAHGSALFTRGETQSLCAATLGTKIDEQIIDNVDLEESKRYMLHYNFPPFSVGEVRPIRGPGRREIGHGNLAERALKTQIPEDMDFPYTIRLVSDILESNGSSSMASVCAGSLALMDAAVPVHETVAGIAMGLIKEQDNVMVLTDILGSEDHYGDMDFKVAGTRQGITAIQMDLKIKGISTEIIKNALEQAKDGRLKIIDIMEKAIKEPRPEISPFAPKIIIMQVDVDTIGDVIGPGGKVIRGIIEKTGAKVDIDDDGTVLISAVDSESGKQAREMIELLTAKPVEGNVYKGVVKRIESYGAFLEILPGKEGLLHISEVDYKHIDNISSVMKIGDTVEVKLKKIDEMGRFDLSRKALLEKPENYTEKRYSRDHNKNRSRNSSNRSSGSSDRNNFRRNR